jgi:hypothetical protein
MLYVRALMVSKIVEKSKQHKNVQSNILNKKNNEKI